MPNRPSVVAARVAAVVAAIGAVGCSFGESGVEPPLDRIYLPAGLAIDPSGDWLMAVNSNSDLRYNAGTVMVVNAAKAAGDRRLAVDRSVFPACPSPGYVAEPPAPPCCWDYFDDGVLDCSDRNYINPKATVRIGSFGSRALAHARTDMAGVTGRLYITVRSEPSVTFLDMVPTPTGLTLHCNATADAAGTPNPLCDEQHKVRGDHTNMAVSALRLLEEPSPMALDDKLGLLYVGHMIEGLSIIDTCTPMPALVSINRRIFSDIGFGVTSLNLERPGDPKASLMVTGRSFAGRPAEVQSLSLRGISGGCGVDGPSPRSVELVESEGFFSSAIPSATDLRGVVETEDGTRAYLLHRNTLSRFNPPAVVEVDRSLDEQGRRRNRAVGLVETCAGATELHLHDPARAGEPGGGQRIYVVCFEAGQVYVLRRAPFGVMGVINVGRGPTAMVFSPNDPGLAYVSGYSDNNISVVDLRPGSPTENRVVQRIGFPLRKR
jgi:DNA-binding beta-propeller fold protein YncE